MTKLEVQQRVLKNGKPLNLDLFSWCEKTNTFSSAEHDLILNFKDRDYCTFNTGSDCTFNTGSNCTFNTYPNCTFKTGKQCVVFRRDVFEVIHLVEGQQIRLNTYNIHGYTIIEPTKMETIQIGNHKYNKTEVEEALKNVRSLD